MTVYTLLGALGRSGSGRVLALDVAEGADPAPKLLEELDRAARKRYPDATFAVAIDLNSGTWTVNGGRLASGTIDDGGPIAEQHPLTTTKEEATT